MGLFGKKDDNENKGRGNKGPKPMHSSSNRFKSKKEVKPMIKQAESEAKRSNAFKSMMNQAVNQAVSTAASGARAGLQRKNLLNEMPIANREKQTTDEQYYDRGDYENSYSPGKKAIDPPKKQKKVGTIKTSYPLSQSISMKGDTVSYEMRPGKTTMENIGTKADGTPNMVPSTTYTKKVISNKDYANRMSAGKKVMDADTEDMPIVTDEKDGAYVAKKYGNPHPAQKRMGDMVAAAQMAYGDKHMSAPSKQVNAEKKKSYDDAFKSRDMKTYGDLSKQEYFNEALRQNNMKSSTGKWDAPSKPMIGRDPNRFEGRPGVEILGDERLAEKGIKSPSSGKPDSDYFVKGDKILGEVSLENKNVVGVNVPETGMLQRDKPIKPKKL